MTLPYNEADTRAKLIDPASQAAETFAVYALVVVAKNDAARALYERYGFIRFPDTASRLFIPIETLRRGAE